MRSAAPEFGCAGHAVAAAAAQTCGSSDRLTATIEHVTELELSEDGDKTLVNLRITINEIGSGEDGGVRYEVGL